MNRLKEFVSKNIFLRFFGLENSLKIYYKLKTGHKLNLENPKRYSEKIQYRKLKEKDNELFALCADKYRVREYIKNKVGEEFLIPLYFAKEKITKDDIAKLPNQFVLKTNNASKTNIIVNDKANENIDKIVKKMNKYVNYEFGYRTFELFYLKIKPLIIAEEKLAGNDGNVPNDYKFFYFNQKNGKYKLVIQVDHGRYSDNHSRIFLDEKWRVLPIKNDTRNTNYVFSKPKNFDTMLRIVKTIGEDFDHVRVDLYEVDDKVYFGELTFTDGSGYELLKPEIHDFRWGNYWILNK